MKNLKIQDTGSYLAGPYVTIDKTEYRISDDGKKAELICTFTPIGNGIAIAKLHVQVQMDRKLQCQSVRTAVTLNP